MLFQPWCNFWDTEVQRGPRMVFMQASQGIQPEVHYWRTWGPQGHDPPAVSYITQPWATTLYLGNHHGCHGCFGECASLSNCLATEIFSFLWCTIFYQRLLILECRGLPSLIHVLLAPPPTSDLYSTQATRQLSVWVTMWKTCSRLLAISEFSSHTPG